MYTSILHTKRLLYYMYSRCSLSTLQLHFDWWATCMSSNMHHDRFLVRHFVRTSGKHLCYTTSFGISLGWSFDFRLPAIRLVACFIHLTVLQHYNVFVHISLGWKHVWDAKKEANLHVVYLWMSCVKLLVSHCDHLHVCVGILQSFCLRQIQNDWN